MSEPAPFTAPAAAAPARMEDIQSHVEAVMGSPEVAAEMVANNEQVPGLTPEENAIFLEMLQQRLAQEELTGEVAVPAGAEATPVKKTKGKKAAGTEPTVTRATPPTDPDTMWSPTVTLDYGAYTIENDGRYPTYSFKTPLAVTPQAALQQLRVTGDIAHLLFTNQKGDKVKVSVAPDHIRLENLATGGLQDYDFGSGKDNPTLTALFGADLLAQLNSAAVENRLPTFLSSLTQRLGLANLDRFTQEYADMLGGKPLAAKTKGKKAAAPVAPVAPAAPAVEDTTVEPTEPRTLDQSFAAMDRTPKVVAGTPSTRPINEIKAAINKARKEGRRDDARELIAELRVRTDKSQMLIPGVEPGVKTPLTRTGSEKTPEALRAVEDELKRLGKEFIAARQEGRKGDARAITDRISYLRRQGGFEDAEGPQIKGTLEMPGTQTVGQLPPAPASRAALRTEIDRVRSLPSLTEAQAALLDRIDDNLPALSPYREDVAEWLNSVRQGRAAPETERYLRQQLAQIERQAQQEVSPRELQGMLAKISRLKSSETATRDVYVAPLAERARGSYKKFKAPEKAALDSTAELSRGERGLLRLIGENQAQIMADADARRTVANWLLSDVGQGIGGATQVLRAYFGIAEEGATTVRPAAKALDERTAQIEKEYAAARQAIDKIAADAGIPMQSLANTIQRLQEQAARAKAAVEKAEPEARGGAKPALTRLANLQGAYNTLLQRVSEASAKYDKKLKETLATSEEMKAAKGRMRKAEDAKNLLDTINDSDSGGARHDARNALNALMPLPKTAEAPVEKKTAPAVQEDLFAEEKEQETAQAENTAQSAAKKAEQLEETKKSQARDEAARKQREREEKLAALPSQRVSFERRREMLRQIDDAPLKRQALEDMVNDANLPQEERDAAQEKLTAYLAKMRKAAADKDESYATAYRLRGEESALVQKHKASLEDPTISDAKKEQIREWYKKAERQLLKRDKQLAKLRGVSINTRETPEQRLETLDKLTRETYGQAVTEEEQAQLDKTKGRALGPVTRKEIQPAKVLYTGDASQIGLSETEKRTYTKPDMRLTEKRGVKQRNVEISKEEMKAASNVKQEQKERYDAVFAADQLQDIAFEKVQALVTAETTIDQAVERFNALKVQPEEKRRTLLEEQRLIKRDLSNAREDLAAANARRNAGIGVESDAETVSLQADLQKYIAAADKMKQRVPAAKRTTTRISSSFLGIKNPLVSEALKDVAKRIRDIRKEIAAAGELEGETGKTKLSKKVKEEVKLLRENSPDYELRDTVDLTGAALEAVKDGRVLDALDAIGANSNSPFVKELVKNLRPLVMRTKLRVTDNLMYRGKRVEGEYDFDTNTVTMDSDALTEEAVLHEMTHAVTTRLLTVDPSQLTKEQRAARVELEKLFKAIQKDKAFANEYGKKSIHEFASEVMSNKALRDKLAARKWHGANLLNKIYRAFMNFIGFKSENMADASVGSIYKLFTPSTTAAKAGITMSPAGIAFPSAVRYANPGLAAAGEIGDTFVAKQRGAIDRVRAAAGGFLGLETQLVDRFAPLDRISKGMEALKGSQMMYYLRMYDQRMNYTAQSVANGAIQRVAKKRPDGRTEYVVESVDGANIKQVVDILKKAPAGSPDAANRLFTMYLAGLRAKNKGFDTLHFGDKLTEAQLDSAMASIRATPGLEENFKQAREVYNEYNRNMVGFLAQSGAISKEHATRLTKENDYIPFYREKDGVASLTIGGESPIRIGSIAEQPYLHELVGGDRPILDFLTSSVQNTALITDMGLRNLATKNAMNELEDMKLAQIREGPGTADPKVVRFKVDGVDHYAVVDTDKAGVPADLLVKGMQGIPTQLPAIVRALGMPATLLRRAVTLSPTYAARQLFRDSLAAPLLSGADFVPVLGALGQLGKSTTKATLEKRGITGGQIFAGGSSSEAITKVINDLLSGKGNVGTLIARAEALNMAADAATRRAQYNSYIKQGLSEMEATLMSLESMNFSKRGASPSIHMANALIPFFNSQIQGLNVLYKALTGKLPFDKRLKIQEKLLTRGALLAAGSLAYAAMMQDDEAYKNATPEQKYGNWFIRIPGVDEPIKFPIPFEIGYLFKALPEAIYNSMANESGSEEAFKALKAIVLQTIPGLSSYFIPQAFKPAIEYGMGKSFYTGRDILSRREQALLPEQQFREGTSEIAKMMGSGLGLSPIKIEALVSGYTGTMGLAFVQALSMGVPTGESPEKTTKRLSDMPVIGGSFQPNDAGGIINAVYERMNDVKKVKATVDRMMSEGRVAEAKELVNKRADEFAQSGVADYFTSNMQQLTKFENAIRASNMTGDEKRAKLTETRQMKIRLAEMVRKATDEAKKVD